MDRKLLGKLIIQLRHLFEGGKLQAPGTSAHDIHRMRVWGEFGRFILGEYEIVEPILPTNKCGCSFCIETYPALMRAKEYLKPDDFAAISDALEASMVHENDVAYLKGKNEELQAEIDRLNLSKEETNEGNS